MSAEKSPKTLLLLTVVLAFCSIVYELLLAQSLAATLGNTVLRYNLTIGTYIASMGFGFICYRKFGFKDLFQRLVKVEIMLAVIGSVSPFAVIIVDNLSNKIVQSFGLDFHGILIQSFIHIVNYSLIIAIGFLSGFELPLLMDIGDKIHKKLSLKVLGYDYIGSMIGVVLFPIVLLPWLGIFGIGILTGLLNACCGLFIILYYKPNQIRYYKIACVIIISALVIIMLNQSDIDQYVVDKIYFAQK